MGGGGGRGFLGGGFWEGGFGEGVPFALDEDRFYKNLRVAKRGAAGGPSGMTAEHLRPLMDSPRDMKLFFKLAERLARGKFLMSSSRPDNRVPGSASTVARHRFGTVQE